MPVTVNSALIACQHCDQLYRLLPLAAGGKASCHRCGSVLYRSVPDSLDRTIAFYLTALMLFVMANAWPFLSLELGGRVEENILISGGLEMIETGMPDIGVMILLTSIVFPFVTIIGMLYLLVPLRVDLQTVIQALTSSDGKAFDRLEFYQASARVYELLDEDKSETDKRRLEFGV